MMDIRTSAESFRRMKAAHDLLLKARKEAEATAISFNRFSDIGRTPSMVALDELDQAIEAQKQTMKMFLEMVIIVDWVSASSYHELISLLAPAEDVFGLEEKNVAVRLAARIGEVFAPHAGEILGRID